MKVSKEIHLGYWIESEKDSPQFNVFAYKPDGEHFILVGTKTVEFEIDDAHDFSGDIVAALRAQQETIRAESQKALTKLDERIKSLLAIECKVSA